MFSQIHPAINNLLTNMENLLAAGRLKLFLGNWNKLTSNLRDINDPFYQNSFNLLPLQKFRRSRRIRRLKNVANASNKIRTNDKGPVSKHTLPNCQKGQTILSGDQCKKVESVNSLQTLQSERSISFERSSLEERLHVDDRFNRHLFCSASVKFR